jgi:hypothetical protein
MKSASLSRIWLSLATVCHNGTARCERHANDCLHPVTTADDRPCRESPTCRHRARTEHDASDTASVHQHISEFSSMKFVLLCSAALLAAAPAFAEEVVASNGADSVRLSDSQCSSKKIMEQVEPAVGQQLKDANANISGQTFKACWVVEGQVAHLVYEDGDEGMVPLTEFHKVG